MQQLLEQALRTSLTAGAEILEVYNAVVPSAVEVKDDKSPLTEADKRAHKKINEGLSNTGIAMLSEEGKSIDFAERSAWKKYWLIDPLDGTKEFIKRNGEFTVNIALIENGYPVMGVIYTPVLSTLYWGIVGEGAWKAENITPGMSVSEAMAAAVKISPVAKNDPYKVVGSRSHSTPETEAFIEELRQQHQQVEFVSMGSSLKICLVAEGKAQVYPRFAPTMEWDTAAGHAIAKAAGCRVYRPDDRLELVYNKENLLNPWFIVEA